MSESHLRRRANAILKRCKRDPKSIENKVGLGTPDTNYIGGWIEYKVATRPKKPTSPIRVDHFTPEQRVWLTRRNYYEGNAFVLLRIGAREHMLFRGDVAAKYLGFSPRDLLAKVALAHWPDGLIEEEFEKWVCVSEPVTSPPASGT